MYGESQPTTGVSPTTPHHVYCPNQQQQHRQQQLSPPITQLTTANAHMMVTTPYSTQEDFSNGQQTPIEYATTRYSPSSIPHYYSPPPNQHRMSKDVNDNHNTAIHPCSLNHVPVGSVLSPPSYFYVKEESMLDLLYEGLYRQGLEELQNQVHLQVQRQAQNTAQLSLDIDSLACSYSQGLMGRDNNGYYLIESGNGTSSPPIASPSGQTTHPTQLSFLTTRHTPEDSSPIMTVQQNPSKRQRLEQPPSPSSPDSLKDKQPSLIITPKESHPFPLFDQLQQLDPYHQQVLELHRSQSLLAAQIQRQRKQHQENQQSHSVNPTDAEYQHIPGYLPISRRFQQIQLEGISANLLNPCQNRTSSHESCSPNDTNHPNYTLSPRYQRSDTATFSPPIQSHPLGQKQEMNYIPQGFISEPQLIPTESGSNQQRPMKRSYSRREPIQTAAPASPKSLTPKSASIRAIKRVNSFVLQQSGQSKTTVPEDKSNIRFYNYVPQTKSEQGNMNNKPGGIY